MKHLCWKPFSLLIIVSLVLTVAACGATAEPTQAPVGEPTKAAAAEGATEVFKLGIVGPFHRVPAL